MAFYNTAQLTRENIDRNLIIDSTILGLGRDGGNLMTEHIAYYLNEYHYKDYDLTPLFKLLREETSSLPTKKSFIYSLEKLYKCNPNKINKNFR